MLSRLSKFFLIALLTISCASKIFAEEEKGITLEELDRIVSQAKDIKEFLSSIEIQNEYYEGLKNYFGGERFPRQSYDKIIEQLKSTQEKFPEIAKRVWETSGMGKPFQIKLTLKSSGLRLKQDTFMKWLDKWKEGLRSTQRSKELSEINKKTDELAAEIRAHYSEMASFPRANRAQKSGEFFESLVKRPAFIEIASAALLERVSKESIGDLLAAGDADLILTTMDSLRKSNNFTLNGRTLPKELQSLVGRLVPALNTPKLEVIDEKPAETDLFIVDTIRTKRGRVIPVGKGSQVAFELRPPPRRIHGLWKGIPINECVAGNCDTTDAITPERWATILLEGTEFYHIERLKPEGRSYEGFMQLVPGNIRGKIYASADFGAPLFGKKIVTSDGRVGIFYDLCLEEFSKQMPPTWNGIVVSESDSVDNSGVLSRIRQRPSYLFGKFASRTDRFVLQDDLAKRLSSLGIRKSHAEKYAGRMIFDAVVPNAGILTVLNPNAVDLPEEITLARAIELMNTNRGTIKETILETILPPKIKTLSSSEREALYVFASKKDSNHAFAMRIYDSFGVGEFTEAELQLLAEFGDEGKKIIVAKAKNMPPALHIILEKWREDSSTTLEEVIPEIKAFTNFENVLKAGLKDPDIAIPSARALQALGIQDSQTDEVIISAMNTKESSLKGVSLVEEYIKSTKAPSTKFLEELIEAGLLSAFSGIVDGARVVISKQGAPSAELETRLVKKIDEVKWFRNQVRIAGIFFDHGNAPLRAQEIYLAVIGDKHWRQKDFIDSLYTIPEIHADALQWLVKKIEKYDIDRTWEIVKFVRDAKNISASALSDTFTPILNHESERMRLAAARMLASKGITSAKIEEILILSDTSRSEKTLASIDSKFQVSEVARDRLVAMIEGGENSGFARNILIDQKNLSDAHIQRLRVAQNKEYLESRYRAAVVLFEKGLADENTLGVLIEPLGEVREWDQNTIVERIKRGLETLPISDEVVVEMIAKVHQYPEESAELIKLIPEKIPVIEGASPEDLALYLRYTRDGTHPKNQEEARAYARLLVNSRFPNAKHIYRLLKEFDGSLGAGDILESGLSQNSTRVRFYSALLLSNHENIWNLDIQRTLAPWFMHPDIPLEFNWSHEALAALLDEVAKIDNPYSDRAQRLSKLFSGADLAGDTLSNLVKLARNKKTENGKFVGSILSSNESARRDSRVQSLLNISSVISNPVTVDDWIEELKTGSKVSEAKDFLLKSKLSAVQKSILREILKYDDSQRRVTSAVVLEHSGEWNIAIESVFLDVCLDKKTGSGWNEKYFQERISLRGLSQTNLEKMLKDLTNKDRQFKIVSMLSEIKLRKNSIRKIRAAQKSAESDVRLLSAAIMVSRKLANKDTARILSSEGIDSRIDSKWLIKTLGSLDLGAEEVESMKKKLFDPVDAERKIAREVFFGIEKPKEHLLAAYESLLDSDDEWIKVHAAGSLEGDHKNPKAELAMVEAMLSPEWNGKFFFERLEGNTQLFEASQVTLAKSLIKTKPKEETFAVRLLRNQISLFPEAEAILKRGTKNSLIREILANKKPRIADGEEDCAENLKHLPSGDIKN